MDIALFGGSFNPPHRGHYQVVKTVSDVCCPDRFLIIPDNIPPHKNLEENSPDPKCRLSLCKLCFKDISGIEISDMEINRAGRSYTADTISQLRREFPSDNLLFIMGTDMLLSFEEWYHFEYLLKELSLVVISRKEGDSDDIINHAQYLRQKYGAVIRFIQTTPVPISSTQVRTLLRKRQGENYLNNEVYQYIIRHRMYGAKPNLEWLSNQMIPFHKKKRMNHVLGVRDEARMLATRWGVDPDTAAEAGLLHDITKKLDYDDQLILIDKYGIMISNSERNNPKLLHAITGAAFAKDQFGISEDVYESIRWHTTGKPDMSLLEKIIYLADCIEPNRDYPGLEKLRKACYEDLDNAMRIGLELSISIIQSRGEEIHSDTIKAYEWYCRKEPC